MTDSSGGEGPTIDLRRPRRIHVVGVVALVDEHARR